MVLSYPSWLPQAIIYQIFPASFQDANGDGVGDLRGIINRLDYLAQLGVNTLWLNPVFDSPFEDAGYDIRDFYKVAPRYGTEADLVELFSEAHARGLRVVLDLVAGHTSMQCAWFQAEAANPRDPESNRYIWKNRDFDPVKGPAKEDFMPSFFWYQPALNYGWDHLTEAWQDPIDAPGPQKNRAELRRILTYWFDRGCDGFRVDMAASLVKHNLKMQGAGGVGNTALWRELRAWLDQEYPDRVLMAEWSSPDKAIEAGFHLDYLIHFNAPGYPQLFFNGSGTLPGNGDPCYFDDAGRGSLKVFRESYTHQRAACGSQGFISLPTANHDFQRPLCGSRTEGGLRPLWVFLLTQAGVPTIYYGDEVGMRFIPDVPPVEGSTLLGIDAENAGGADGERAGTRTPMQWDATANAGFSTAPAEALYLPLDPDPHRPTVAAQLPEPGSHWHFARHLITLRQSNPALGASGSFEILNVTDEEYPLAILRESPDGAQRCLIVVNPAARTTSTVVPLKNTTGLPLSISPLLEHGCRLVPSDGTLAIEADAFAYGIFELS